MTETLANGAALLDLYPQLSGLGKSSPFIEAIADDRWLTEIGPFLRLPDYLSNEDALWAAMIGAVPELATFDLPPPSGVSGLAGEYRIRARRAAVRTLACACNLGAPTFTNHALLAGDPSIKVSPGPGLTCRIGLVGSVAWKPTPTLLERTMSAIRTNSVLADIERAIFPLIGIPNYGDAFARWKQVEPLRTWDEQNRLPFVGVRCVMSTVPSRYVERYSPDDLVGTNVPFHVAARIVSPYAADLVRAQRTSAGSVSHSEESLLLWAVNRCGR